MSRFWSHLVTLLTPYVPGEQPKKSNLIKLNTNENPYGPSPEALQAIKDATNDSLKLYPDPSAQELKDTLADYHQVNANQVFVGNGSDEVLAHAFQALLKHDQPLLTPNITYSFYPTYSRLYQIELKTIALTPNFDIDVDDYTTPNGGIILPNPNAPTGKLLPLSQIEALLKANPDSVVVIDEAYIDFGGDTAIALVNDYTNLLVVQTFSKSRSLAGLRIGFAIGHPDLIDGLERVKNSFNSYPMDRLAIPAAVASIKDEAYFQQTCQTIINTRESTVKSLEKMGFNIIPSAANFVFATHPKHDALAISQALRNNDIIVRYFDKPHISQHLRITIGTEAQMKSMAQVLLNFLKK